MTLLDTSVWIEFLKKRGDRDVKLRVASMMEAGETAHCDPVLFELLCGARENEVPHIREALGFSLCLDFATREWERAAWLENRLRRQGITIPRDDLFVAAVGLTNKVPLFALDHHFEIIRDVADAGLRLV